MRKAHSFLTAPDRRVLVTGSKARWPLPENAIETSRDVDSIRAAYVITMTVEDERESASIHRILLKNQQQNTHRVIIVKLFLLNRETCTAIDPDIILTIPFTVQI